MAATRRNRGIAETAMKWKGPPSAPGAKGIKPVADPMSVSQMGVVLAMHLCRKILLWDSGKKIVMYAAMIMLGSVLCDFFPLPKNFLWHKGGLLNRYFAKFCWGWTLCVLSAYVGLTSYVYCCGVKSRIRRHLSRLLIGTVCWYTLTTAFVAIEAATGTCVGVELERSVMIDPLDRDTCLKRGLRWRGFDISGHVFLLIYCSLVIHEEAKSIKGWERIKDLIRDADYDPDSPLEALNAEQVELLKTSYERFGPYVRGLFMSLTVLCLIWDFQVLGTVLYYHSMAQKVSGGLIAILAWFFTYRVWYLSAQSPGLPGQGTFKFAEVAATAYADTKDRRRSLNTVTPRAKLWRNGHSAGEPKSE